MRRRTILVVIAALAATLMSATNSDAVLITQHQIAQRATGIFAWPGGVTVSGVSPGVSVSRVSDAPAFSITPDVPGTEPLSFCVGAEGHIWFLGTITEKLSENRTVAYHGIYEITPTGTVLRFHFPAVFVNDVAGGEIVMGSDHAFWIAQWGLPEIDRYEPGTGNFMTYKLPSGGVAISITSGIEGSLWFTDSTGEIGRITTQGEITEHLIEDGDTEYAQGLMQPYGIAEGADGDLYFTEQVGRIGRMTPSWQLKEFTVPIPQGHTLGNGGPSPRYIVAGPEGAMWFTDPGDDSIGRLTTSGEVSEYPVPAESPKTSDASAIAGAAPDRIVDGPEGLLWFTEDSKQLGSVDPNGTPVPIVTTPTSVSSHGSSASTSDASFMLPAQVSCSNATASPCIVTTTATVSSSTATKTSVRATRAGARQGKALVVIGHAATKLAGGGATRFLRLALTGRGFALLRSRHTLAIIVTVTVTGSGRATMTRTLHFQVKFKKAAKTKTDHSPHK